MSSNGTQHRHPRVLAIDAGGTLTDTFIVDENGDFVVGKAQTTAADESIGFMQSTKDALDQWGHAVDEALPQIKSGIYSGTAMLNRLLERRGLRVGVIVSAGQEDALALERGIQTYLGYSYADRLHAVTHYHNEPLASRDRVKGVRGRIDMFGEEVLPLREIEAREAAQALLDDEVEGIVISLLFSYVNPAHERRVAEIVREEVESRGVNVPVFVSSELYPVRRDLPRLNTTLIEAYAAEPSRRTMHKVRTATKNAGAEFELRVMASHGGTISTEAKELARTLISGPIGGVIGAQAIARHFDLPNVVCTDIGGTSFDMALITDGRVDISDTPDIGRFVISVPMVRCDSIGAGTGSFVRLDPNSLRPELGPDSAGARIGVSWPEGGIETITITDLNFVLGRLDADGFLEGRLNLDVERAEHAVTEQLAKPLGLSAHEAAAGVIELFESTLRNEAVGRILGKGYAPEDYALLCYGGGGPLHVAGYTGDVPYQDILVPAWAAGFSAFGCACADFEYRYERTVDLAVPPDSSAEQQVEVGATLTEAWRELEDRVAAEFAKSGVERDEIEFRHTARLQYLWQLNDIEVDSRHREIETVQQLQDLIDEFEIHYGRIYARSARSPELGYSVTNAIVTGRTEVEKPAFPERPEDADGAPPQKGARNVYWNDGFAETPTFDLADVKPGHVIEGPGIVEAPATTFAIPADRSARLDQNNVFHLGRIS